MRIPPAYWAVLPAAGVGRRMGSALPKQYMELAGRTVIEHSMALFVDDGRFKRVLVALDAADGYWDDTAYASDPKVLRAKGGSERCHSVLNALEMLCDLGARDDFVLVHDAARPCLRRSDLDRLIESLSEDEVGGLLGIQVRDTMKRADPGKRVAGTLDRSQLWHAFTPQMFRLGLLHDALRDALAVGEMVTDESAAIERIGLTPRLVEGHADNIKITRAEDLPLADFYLRRQASGEAVP